MKGLSSSTQMSQGSTSKIRRCPICDLHFDSETEDEVKTHINNCLSLALE